MSFSGQRVRGRVLPPLVGVDVAEIENPNCAGLQWQVLRVLPHGRGEGEYPRQRATGGEIQHPAGQRTVPVVGNRQRLGRSAVR